MGMWNRTAGTVLAAGLVVLAGCGSPREESGTSGEILLHVRPFTVQGEDREAAYVCQAFADSMANNLKQATGLTLVDEEGDLQPDRILSGTLTRDGLAVHATLELTDGSTGNSLWQTEADATGGDLSDLASRLSRASASALEAPFPHLYPVITDLVGGQELMASPLTEQALTALRQYNIGAFLADTNELVQRFDSDPVAHVWNAWALVHTWSGAPERETLTRLKDRLVELNRVDPDSPYDELLHAFIYRSSGNPDWALELYTRVLARDDLATATRAWALRQRAYAYVQVGNTAAALSDADASVKLDPAGAANLVALSRALQDVGRLDDAFLRSRQALALEPSAWRHHQRAGVVLTRAGRFDEAVEQLERACELSDSQEACGNLAVALLRSGKKDEARQVAERTRKLAGSPWGMYNLACFWALAGEREPAVDSLRRALALGFADMLVSTDTDLDSLRDDPEFQKIITAIEDKLRAKKQVSESLFPFQA